MSSFSLYTFRYGNHTAMSLVKECRSFCERTSMKGVPRIVTPSRPYLRGLWFVSVFTMLIICLYQVGLLVTTYLQYSKSYRISSEFLTSDSSKRDGLPNLAACNLQPFSSNLSQRPSNLLSMEEYRLRVLNLTTCDECPDMEQKLLSLLRQRQLTPRGYSQMIGAYAASKIGHQLDTFLVSCSLLSYQGVGMTSQPCREDVTIKSSISPDFINCYTFQISEQQLEVVPLGLSLIFYLDNHFNDDLHFLSSTDGAEDITVGGMGVRLITFQRGTMPLISATWVEVPPGTNSVVKYYIRSMRRLERPWGNCSYGSKGVDLLKEFGVPYTKDNCISMCISVSIYETCNCSASPLFETGEHAMWNSTLPCDPVQQSREELIRKSQCAQKIGMIALRKCNEGICHAECHSMSYENAFSYSKWPSQSQLRTLYKNCIKEAPYSVLFPKYDFQAKVNEPYKSTDYVELHKLIAENFVKVTWYLGHYEYFDISEETTLSFLSLISQVGGTFNLWSGISFIFIIETLELFIRVCVSVFNRNTGGNAQPRTTIALPQCRVHHQRTHP